MRVAVGQGEEAIGLEGPHVGDADPEARKARHEPREPGQTGEGIAVRHGSHVEHEAEALRLARARRPGKPRVVDGEALDGAVQLEAASPRPSMASRAIRRQVGVVGVQGAQGGGLREPRRRLGYPLVERPGPCRAVGVREEAEALDAAGAQGLGHGLGSKGWAACQFSRANHRSMAAARRGGCR